MTECGLNCDMEIVGGDRTVTLVDCNDGGVETVTFHSSCLMDVINSYDEPISLTHIMSGDASVEDLMPELYG